VDTAGAIALLEGEPAYRGQIVHVEQVPSRAGRHRAPGHPLPSPLHSFLDQRSIDLYTHQADAYDAWASGADVVIAAGTAGGKTLAFNLAVADALLGDSEATALYLYPTKALAQDQLGELLSLDATLHLSARPAIYDGDTPAGRRRQIRTRSRIIVSNPYGLHEYLPQHAGWQSFMSKLAVVVVDEAHRYRGVFGSHVAYVIRRLRRLTAALGASPRFVLASATIANPGQLASALVGRPVLVVDDDGRPAPARAVALWDSMRDPERSGATQAADVVAGLARMGHRTLCFTGSRAGAELVALAAADRAPSRRIGAYRAGYRTGERREIEAQLRDGTLDALVSTNALELGIDISGLDAVVLTGYPGTIASTWQQIGRAGRAGQPALSVLVAGEDPLDQYFIRRPAVLFGSPVERATVSLENPAVLAGELLCAAAELPIAPEDEAVLLAPGAAGGGEPARGPLEAALADLVAKSLIAPTRAGYVYTGTSRPASDVHLDGRRGDTVEVRFGDALIEVLEYWRALRSAYPGAILLHRGQRYRILRLDLDRHVAQAEPIDIARHTRPTTVRHIDLGEVTASRPVGSWTAYLGEVRIEQRVTGYALVEGSEVVSRHDLELPANELSTRGIWTYPDPDLELFTGPPLRLLGALHAVEHGLIHAMPLLAMCDRGDVGGMSSVSQARGQGEGLPGWQADPQAVGQAVGRQGGPAASIVLHDGREGGGGIAEMAFERLEELASITREMLASCDCEGGCPRCVYDRDCGSGNQPMDRRGAVGVLDTFVATLPGGR
jgi:DEAD/DEAH box helicase domain-containing protein